MGSSWRYRHVTIRPASMDKPANSLRARIELSRKTNLPNPTRSHLLWPTCSKRHFLTKFLFSWHEVFHIRNGLYLRICVNNMSYLHKYHTTWLKCLNCRFNKQTKNIFFVQNITELTF